MMRVLATGVLILAALGASAQPSMMGKTKSQALKMGFSGWYKHVNSKVTNEEQYTLAIKWLHDAAVERNNRLIARLPAKRKAAINKSRELTKAAVLALHTAAQPISERADIVRPKPWKDLAYVEQGTYRILTKAKMPGLLLTGNFFRELEDGYLMEREEAAKGNGMEALAKELSVKAVESARKARASYSGLAEKEANFMRQVLVYMFDPEESEAPFKW